MHEKKVILNEKRNETPYFIKQNEWDNYIKQNPTLIKYGETREFGKPTCGHGPLPLPPSLYEHSHQSHQTVYSVKIVTNTHKTSHTSLPKLYQNLKRRCHFLQQLAHMVEQLFIHKPKIYPFSIVFSLSSRMGVALSLPQHFAPQTVKQIGVDLEQTRQGRSLWW